MASDHVLHGHNCESIADISDRLPQQTIGYPNNHAQSPLSAGTAAATPSDMHIQGGTDVSATPPAGVPTRWWGGGDIPAHLDREQSQRWHRVKESVEKATKLTLDVIHEGLETSLSLLDLVPVPLVQSAAQTLLMIWSNLQSVDMNQQQYLRLTERCADILTSIGIEIEKTADGQEISGVAEELKGPLEGLVDSFKQVNTFLEHQSHLSFLMRYLKRDEILRQIQSCDASLADALGMFSMSIQIRTLKQVLESERRQQEDTKRILESIAASNVASAGQGQATTTPVPPSASVANALPSGSSVSTVVPFSSIRAATSSNPVLPLPRPPIINNSQTTLVAPFPDMAPADGGADVSGGRPDTIPEFSDVQGGFAQDVASGLGAPIALQDTGDATLRNWAPLLPPSLIGLRPELVDRGPQLMGWDNLHEAIEDTNLKMPISEIPQPPPNNESLEPPFQTKSLATSHSGLSPADIRETFNAVRIKQSQADQARDSEDLRRHMRAALQTPSDAALTAVLQVGRDEMPEAIKTLQRALERLFDRTLGLSDLPSIKDSRPLEAGRDEVSQSPPMSPSMTQRPVVHMPTISSSELSSDSSMTLKDTLDREFMESGIDALRRLSGVVQDRKYPPGKS
ncbi:hypothetical protein FISHEDRAFT_74925 [Fistulina hepatica ATCC 64428]|uniref:Uncharacterized protein n=1 Tax=Fistulina hepatica ATCC 64428 TaxID=1128425 RepID=A0A0D7AB64_9AGAR|nr:hypothetical protein FISHEDRAFT_74925 [Fistulina hepatica ATCC 64428]